MYGIHVDPKVSTSVRISGMNHPTNGACNKNYAGPGSFMILKTRLYRLERNQDGRRQMRLDNHDIFFRGISAVDIRSSGPSEHSTKL